jgi:hypothetical protein
MVVAAQPMAAPAGFEGLVLAGAICAAAAAGLTVVWLAVMALAPLPEGTPAEIRAVAGRPRLQVLRFGPTTVIALLYVPVWLALAAVLWEGAPGAAVGAAGFGLLYTPLCAAGYWLQYTAVAGIAALHGARPEAAEAAYEVVGFGDRRSSVTGSLVVLGYTLWGLGGLFAGIGLLAHDGTAATAAGVLFLVTAALAVAGAAGRAAGSRLLEAGVLLSGVASLGATVAASVVLFGSL